jgi:hypothetical protein
MVQHTCCQLLAEAEPPYRKYAGVVLLPIKYPEGYVFDVCSQPAKTGEALLVVRYCANIRLLVEVLCIIFQCILFPPSEHTTCNTDPAPCVLNQTATENPAELILGIVGRYTLFPLVPFEYKLDNPDLNTVVLRLNAEVPYLVFELFTVSFKEVSNTGRPDAKFAKEYVFCVINSL